MKDLQNLIAMTLSSGCLFVDYDDAKDHVIQLLQFNVMNRANVSLHQINEALKGILTDGVDGDLWSSFGCEYSAEHWEALLADVARDLGARLE